MDDLPPLPDVTDGQGFAPAVPPAVLDGQPAVAPALPAMPEGHAREEGVPASQAPDDLDPGSSTEPEEAEPLPTASKSKVGRKKSTTTTERGDQTRIERVTAHGFWLLAPTDKLKRPGTELLRALNANAAASESLAEAVALAQATGSSLQVDAGATTNQTDTDGARSLVRELERKVDALAASACDTARAPEGASLTVEVAALRTRSDTDHAYLARLGGIIASTHRALQDEQAKTLRMENEIASLTAKLRALAMPEVQLPELPSPLQPNALVRPRSPANGSTEGAQAAKRPRLEPDVGALAGSSAIYPAINIGPWRTLLGKPLHEVGITILDAINALPDAMGLGLPFAVTIGERNATYATAVFTTEADRDAVLKSWRNQPRIGFVAQVTPALVREPPQEAHLKGGQPPSFRRR